MFLIKNKYKKIIYSSIKIKFVFKSFRENAENNSLKMYGT